MLKLKTIKETIPSITRQKVNEAFTFVEKLTYLDKVQLTQKKVMEAKVSVSFTIKELLKCFIQQDSLQDIGEHKRTIHRELSLSRRLFDEVREEIRTTNRFHDRQVELWEKEKDIASKITQYEHKLIDVDDKERLCFISLTSAINSSYEAEKLHSNSLKVWGLMGTCTATVFTFIISLIGYYFHNNRLGAMSKEFHETVKIELSALKVDLVKQFEEERNRERERIAQEVVVMKQSTNHLKESWGSWLSRHGRSWWFWSTWRQQQG